MELVKNDLDRAINQVGLIQNAIERSQSKWEGLSRMLIAYGCMRLLLDAIQFPEIFVLDSKPFYLAEIIIEIVLYVGLFVYYVFLYRKEKGTGDKYYLACLKLFGFIVFAFQFSSYFIILFEQTQKIEVKAQSMVLIQNQAMIANMLLFCLCTVVCSLIRERRGMTFVSVLVLLLFLFLSVPFRSCGFSVPALISTRAGSPVFTFCGLYYYLVTSVGYIVIGSLLKRRRRHPDANQ